VGGTNVNFEKKKNQIFLKKKKNLKKYSQLPPLAGLF